jgi:hypothetical protein
MKTPAHTCAACGYRQLRYPQRSADGGASHEICPSCGFESGFTDDDQGLTHQDWRTKWVTNGMPWFGKGTERPTDWNPMQDLVALNRRKRPVIPQNRLRKAIDKVSTAPTSSVPDKAPTTLATEREATQSPRSASEPKTESKLRSQIK